MGTMKSHSGSASGASRRWLAAGSIAFVVAFFLLPRASTASDALGGLNVAPRASACPDDCHAKSGWGECVRQRCVCKLGRGGPACTFSLSSIYGSTPVYDLTKDNGLQPADLSGWSPPAETYESYLDEADAVTVVEIGVWKGARGVGLRGAGGYRGQHAVACPSVA